MRTNDRPVPPRSRLIREGDDAVERIDPDTRRAILERDRAILERKVSRRARRENMQDSLVTILAVITVLALTVVLTLGVTQ